MNNLEKAEEFIKGTKLYSSKDKRHFLETLYTISNVEAIGLDEMFTEGTKRYSSKGKRHFLETPYNISSLEELGLDVMFIAQSYNKDFGGVLSFLVGVSKEKGKILIKTFPGKLSPLQKDTCFISVIQDRDARTNFILAPILCEGSSEFKKTFDFMVYVREQLRLLKCYEYLRVYNKPKLLDMSDFCIIGRVLESLGDSEFVSMQLSYFTEVATKTSKIPLEIRESIIKYIAVEKAKKEMGILNVKLGISPDDYITFYVTFKSLMSVKEIEQSIKNNRKSLHKILEYHYVKSRSKYDLVTFDYYEYASIRMRSVVEVFVSMKLKAADV